MPVAVQMPQRREEKDPLDTILKGLQIAGGIYNIADASKKAKLLEQEQAYKKQKYADEQKQEADKIAFEEAKALAEFRGKNFLIPAGTKSIRDIDMSQVKMDPEYLKLRAEADPFGLKSLQATKIKEEMKLGPKMTEAEKGAVGFVKRAEQANQVFQNLEAEGFDRSSIAPSLQSLLPGSVQSKSMQQQEQAERNFVNAVLRPESGATITDAEFENARKQYFPRYGDSPEVKAQKAETRMLAIEGLKARMGGVASKTQGADVITMTESPADKLKALKLEKQMRLQKAQR